MRHDSFKSMIDALHQAGLNDSRIAEQTGLARSTIHRYARGEARAPGFDTVTRSAICMPR
jgi:transcriptional regulator with XRE-family HTH domain